MSTFAIVKAAVTNKTAHQVLLAKKHSPTALMVAGTVGVVGTVVLACRATLKVSDVLEKHEKHTGYISEEAGTEQISHEDANKQLNKVKVQTAVEIAKLYALPIGLGVLSIGALTGSHIILQRRNSAVMAAYAAMQKGYDSYRERVRKELGDERDREFAYGVSETEVMEKLADGSTKTTNQTHIGHTFGSSPYAVMFDARSKHFTTMPGMNRHTLSMIQSYANDKLKAKGHLTLNEVYDMLDLPRTQAGFVVGWIYKKDNPIGDNYISFGVFDNPDVEWVEKFVDGRENEALLDFNVDGVIYDKI